MFAEQLEWEENIRIARQIETLGPEGLQRAEAELQEAKAEHDRPNTARHFDVISSPGCQGHRMDFSPEFAGTRSKS
jgi:hypothetical protein